MGGGNQFITDTLVSGIGIRGPYQNDDAACKNKIVCAVSDYLRNEEKDWISDESGQHDTVNTVNDRMATTLLVMKPPTTLLVIKPTNLGDRVLIESSYEVDGLIQPMVTGEEW